MVNTKAHLAQKRWIRGRYHDSCALIFRVRECYHHSYAISKLRAGVSAGLGGFVGFRQLPDRPDECDGLAKIDRASGSERSTKVTAENLRSRRPEFLARARGPRATRAGPGEGCEGRATREVSLRSTGGGYGSYTFLRRGAKVAASREEPKIAATRAGTRREGAKVAAARA